ncbi:hypothetical protein ACB092_07G120800 [Castanea dentata]
MGSKSGQLHIFFFPFMAQGHMIPAIDMAKLFAARGVKATFVTTPLNMPVVSKTIEKTKACGINIDIKIIKFPAVEAGLLEGYMIPTFVLATSMLRQPLEELIQEYQPSCIVADVLFPWAVDVATKFGIPRLEFYGCNCQDFTRQEVETDFSKFMKEASESVLRSYGVVVNSFYELEPDYIDYYRNVLGRKAWHLGPVSLCNKDTKDKAQRGKEASIDEHECLKWLATKKPNSVYIFVLGVRQNLVIPNSWRLQWVLRQFIWVVRKGKNEKAEEDWLPKESEKRMEGKELIIRGWARQVLILDHEAVGGFVTHCGWNSTLEGVAAGVPMVTWPVAAEQFYNEKLVTQVLKIGVSVGAQQWIRMVGDGIKREAIQKAKRQITVGEEAKEMRGKAKVLGEMARRVIEEGGSSYSDLNALIEELKSHCP